MGQGCQARHSRKQCRWRHIVINDRVMASGTGQKQLGRVGTDAMVKHHQGIVR
jgi:hypothetical protein